MKAVKEITVWDEAYQPNHTYLVDGDKMIAYIPKGSVVPFYFSQPIAFSTKGRKFADVTPSPFTKVIVDTRVPVAGSKGEIYMVDPVTLSCMCTSYRFKGKCRHPDQLK